MPLFNHQGLMILIVDLSHWRHEALDDEFIVVSLRRQLIHALDLLGT